MDIQLLPANSHLVDYKTYESGIIYRQYLLDGNVYHFSLHPDVYPQKEQLEFTGRYLAVFTSVRGLETFYLVPNEAEDSFTVDDAENDETEAVRLLGKTDNDINADMQEMLRQANIQGTIDAHEADDTPEPEEEDTFEIADEPIEGFEWLQFDPQTALLPLMVTAIKDYRNL